MTTRRNTFKIVICRAKARSASSRWVTRASIETKRRAKARRFVSFQSKLRGNHRTLFTISASCREVANARLMSAPYPSRHRPPPGRRIAPPDDGLQRAIQYSEASVMESKSCGVLDTPLIARGMTAVYEAPPPSLPATNAKRLRKGALATKQSTLSLRGEVDCFAALAMTVSWLFEN